jgi:hypothetical protein
MEEHEHEPTEDHAKPELLFHYTGQSGLDGILKDDCIWATHYRFLNDSVERQHGLDIYKDAILRIASEHFGAVEPAKTLAEYFQRSYTNALNAYIVSFCTSYTKEEYEIARQTGVPLTEDGRGGDRLSQWRGYVAPGSQGYCLAFDFQLLRQIHQFSLGRCYYKFCIYPDDIKRKWVETHVSELFDPQASCFAISDLKNLDSLRNALKKDQTRNDMVKEFICDMVFLCGILKHIGFKEENEYRLIKFVLRGKSNPENVCLAPESKPHIEIPLNLAGENSPLRAIFVGPSANRDQAAIVLRIRLEQMGLSHVEVIPSDIPYRG